MFTQSNVANFSKEFLHQAEQIKINLKYYTLINELETLIKMGFYDHAKYMLNIIQEISEKKYHDIIRSIFVKIVDKRDEIVFTNFLENFSEIDFNLFSDEFEKIFEQPKMSAVIIRKIDNLNMKNGLVSVLLKSAIINNDMELVITLFKKYPECDNFRFHQYLIVNISDYINITNYDVIEFLLKKYYISDLNLCDEKIIKKKNSELLITIYDFLNVISKERIIFSFDDNIEQIISKISDSDIKGFTFFLIKKLYNYSFRTNNMQLLEMLNSRCVKFESSEVNFYIVQSVRNHNLETLKIALELYDSQNHKLTPETREFVNKNATKEMMIMISNKISCEMRI